MSYTFSERFGFFLLIRLVLNFVQSEKENSQNSLHFSHISCSINGLILLSLTVKGSVALINL